MHLVLGVTMTLCLLLLTRFKITRTLLNQDNLTQFFFLIPQMKTKSVKLLKTEMFVKTCEDSEIPTKIIKNLIWIYLVVLFVSNFNYCMMIGELNS